MVVTSFTLFVKLPMNRRTGLEEMEERVLGAAVAALSNLDLAIHELGSSIVCPITTKIVTAATGSGTRVTHVLRTPQDSSLWCH